MNITVGIVSGPGIRFFLRGAYRLGEEGRRYTGALTVTRNATGCTLVSGTEKLPLPLPLEFVPLEPEVAEFELADVTIGIDFHWERKENQRFRGTLRLIEENGKITAVNLLPLEEYLLSVISSEMNATSSEELLKAHAVISRSWLVAQQQKSRELKGQRTAYRSLFRNEQEYIRWFDREDHLHYDVCADDHCQRYQGIQKATTRPVYNAVQATRGEVLIYKERICDARFSKCCGGVSESFENVWEPAPHPYLKPICDAPDPALPADLTVEANSLRWIQSRPEVFCHTQDVDVLSEVLNDYDRETPDFFRWEVCYGREELSALLRERLEVDFGEVTGLIPLERGASGRIIRLRIEGTKRSLVIGKELLIRKALSRSHLYSSAFVVEKITGNGILQGFRLRGAGWGHGVGLCQIGAAVMSSRGYSYREILAHYFPGSRIEKQYH
ncbi:MAG: SpoIID/LytB domain-containing protein [Culturomica sp.]|jgi:SpoIID/LytB domain protein|nr:SpoIID/LytB domain-containing protein [Culturomica sp.]